MTTGIDHILGVVRLGYCVVMGIGVTQERLHSLAPDSSNQDFLVVGRQNSAEAKFIATRALGEAPESKSITIDDVEMDAYLIIFEEGAA